MLIAALLIIASKEKPPVYICKYPLTGELFASCATVQWNTIGK